MTKTRILCLIVCLLALIGCGGGSGSVSSGLSLFITDDLSSHDHVWVTIKKIEVTPTGGSAVTMFESAAGVSVDLRTLRDVSGSRFKFLSSRSLSMNSVSRIDVTVDQNLVLFTSGATTGLNRTFVGAAGGVAVLTKILTTPRTIGSDDDLIVDFKLSEWVDNGTTVTGVIDVKDDSTIDDLSRHESEDYRGTVAGLTGTIPNQSFTMTIGGASVRVDLDASTALYNSNGTPSPVLANDQVVEVRGVFDTTNNQLQAASIKIKNGGSDEDDHEISGTPSDIVAPTQFSVSPQRSYGFLPTSSKITVSTSGTTRFFGHRGVSMTEADFYAALATAIKVEVEGAYNAGTTTIAATKVKLENEDGDDDGEAEVRGDASLVDSVAKTFKVAATEYSGLTVTPGSLISVATDGSTTFRGNGNTTLTEAEFYAQAGAAASVEVEGQYNASSGVLTAKKAKIEDGVGGDEGEFKGMTSNSNVDLGTFSVTVNSFESVPFSNGQLVSVVTNGSTTFRYGGNTVDKATFFAALPMRVEVEGTYNVGTGVFTAKKVKDDN